MEDIVKEYCKDDLTIIWQPKKCIHSKKCWIELGEVFNPKLKPWIDVTKANSQRIMEQVNKCPSGALSIKSSSVSENESESESEKRSSSESTAEIVVLKSGPLMIKGNVSLVHKDGKEEKQTELYLCRCGQSDNKPFCDGTHNKCGFKDE